MPVISETADGKTHGEKDTKKPAGTSASTEKKGS